MNYLTSLIIATSIVLLCACGAKEETQPLTPSPLVALLAPTLASALASADTAINTALEKSDYPTQTIQSLTELKTVFDRLTSINQRLIHRGVNSDSAVELSISANEIHQLRGLIEADIIALKHSNAAAAIRLGVVNELAEFCQLTAQDISQAMSPAEF
ncbi:hypothetical protein R50072_00980 [Simiduia litorea]|uniref:hypothetical protein n=1 Tax=Simiduia litorea TaxID=1435348 RepID=UPI0036F213CD